MYRFALLGAGFIGSVHATNLANNPGVDFCLVYDIDWARAEQIAIQHGTRATNNIDEAFDPNRIDAVLIASSTDTHAAHLRHAADVGAAVLCEKPIDLDLNRATEVARYVHRRGIRAMVDFNRRFDRDYAELKRAVDADEIGDVELIQLTTRGPAIPPLEYIAVSGGQLPTRRFISSTLRGGSPASTRSRSTPQVQRWPSRGSSTTTTSTPPLSLFASRPVRSFRSTAPGASATATTNASRWSVPPE